ncbi:MAG: sigma factor [Thermoleophilia bacterium]
MRPEPGSEERLVARCAAGDEAALGELYDRLGRPAYALARRVVGDATLAEDVVQEAFLDAWRAACRFDVERGRAATWLLTLVHRRAVGGPARPCGRNRSVPAVSAASSPLRRTTWSAPVERPLGARPGRAAGCRTQRRSSSWRTSAATASPRSPS